MIVAVVVGCRSRDAGKFKACPSKDCYQALATQIEYPQVSQCSTCSEDWASLEPITLANLGETEYWEVTLEEVVQLSLSQSKVLRDLGGAILRSPSSADTYWDPALQETDPRFGVDAALSAFDAQFTTSVFGEKNDKALNNEFFGGGTRILQQDSFTLQSQLTKRSVAGSELTFRHNAEYDANNAPGNQFPSAWNVNLETEFRHPLLQGSGMKFNRIAGPSKTPGIYGGGTHRASQHRCRTGRLRNGHSQSGQQYRKYVLGSLLRLPRSRHKNRRPRRCPRHLATGPRPLRIGTTGR